MKTLGNKTKFSEKTIPIQFHVSGMLWGGGVVTAGQNRRILPPPPPYPTHRWMSRTSFYWPDPHCVFFAISDSQPNKEESGFSYAQQKPFLFSLLTVFFSSPSPQPRTMTIAPAPSHPVGPGPGHGRHPPEQRAIHRAPFLLIYPLAR